MAGDPIKVITLHDGANEVPIWVENGQQGLVLNSLNPSSIFSAGGGPGKYGDNEPLFAFNEARTWEGGRGLEFFGDDQTRYYDSHRSWTLTPGKLGPAPQWFFAIGHRANGADFTLPGNVTWQVLYGDTRYVSRKFTAAANLTADKAYVWVRRVGTPGTLTLEMCDDSAGDPSTVNQTVTVTTSTIDDYESVLVPFDWTGTEALTISTDYHIKVYGASTDNQDNHWRVAVDNTTSSGTQSSDNASWTNTPFSMYYRVVGADVDIEWRHFFLDEVLYFVSTYRDGSTASKLYMNGERGEATAGGAATLTDTDVSFGTSSEYVGALVKIIRGTGAGQVRTIASHTDTALTVSENWLTNPDVTSEYYVYQTPRVQEIGTTGLGVVTTVAVYNLVAHFGHAGAGDPIRKMEFTAASSAHSFKDDSTNEANVLAVGHIAGTGGVAWRAVNADGDVKVSRAPFSSYGGTHTFATAFEAGNGAYPVNSMQEVIDSGSATSRLAVYKTGENGYISDDKWYRENLDIASFAESTNGKASIVHGLYQYFNWSWSLERKYGAAVDDIDPNREAGFPTSRQGYISALATHPVGPMLSIDADTGTSSTHFYDGVGYHELFRGFEAGKRISTMTWQSNEGGKKYFWIGVGDDLVYMEFPRFHRNPFRDSTQKFMHEFSLTTATHDFNNSSIYKVWKDITIISRNMNGLGRFCEVDYQTDEDIDSSTWTAINAGILSKSPSDTLELFIGETKQIRFRLRFYTDDATKPIIVNAFVIKGVGQLETKFQTTFRGLFGGTARGLGADNMKGLDLLREGTPVARVWTITQCHFKELVGEKVLATIIDKRPQYNINNQDNVEATITLYGLSD